MKRPAIPYYGGKFKMTDWVISFFPKHRLYLEPFAGAASVLLAKKKSKVEIYNDVNEEVVNLFQVLRNPEQACRLRKLLQMTPYSRDEWKLSFERVEDPIEQARRTIVIHFMSCGLGKVFRRYPNGFRINSKNHDHVQTWTRYIDFMPALTERLLDCIIKNFDAIQLIQRNNFEDALCYCDPPYLMTTRKNKRMRYPSEMMKEEEHELLLDSLLRYKGFVVISGYDSELYNDTLLPRGWKKHSTLTMDGSGKAKSCKREECIWVNQRVVDSMRIRTLFN